ncbi:hypothetical protein [Roseinatronobacter monicus]|uniref:hypothetical protein n=1 Tax=Roseinatronobacter monicus TaxID=393481 RepID=UPI0011504129|nr:hypothetical protein [Roseinatronobacter monicus]
MIEADNEQSICLPFHIRTGSQHYYSQRASFNLVCLCLCCASVAVPAIALVIVSLSASVRALFGLAVPTHISLFLPVAPDVPYTVIYQQQQKTSSKLNTQKSAQLNHACCQILPPVASLIK